MKLNAKIGVWYAIVFILILFFTCSKIEYGNPFDSKSIYNGHPVIVLKGPDTVSVVWHDTFSDPGFVVKDDNDKYIEQKVVKEAKNSKDEKVSFEKLTDKKGSYRIFYNVTDKDNKKAETQIRIVSVVDKAEINDTIAPIISLTGSVNITINLGELFNDSGTFTAIDDPGSEDVSDDVIRTVKDDKGTIQSIDDFFKEEGVYVVSYSVRDASGNGAEKKERKVTVKPDIEKPVLTLLGPSDTSLFVSQTYVEMGATAIDNVDGDLTEKITIGGDVVNTAKAATYKVKYTVSDKTGNTASLLRTVMVKNDITPPKLKLNGEDTVIVDFGKQYIEKKATAIDDIDGDLTSKIQISGMVDPMKVDTYYVTYTVVDGGGNKAEIERVVIVVDTIFPVITMNPPKYVNLTLGNKYVEKGATAMDNADGDVTSVLDTSGNVDDTKVGVYTITYSVTDKSGNKTDSVRIITITAESLNIQEEPVSLNVPSGHEATFSIRASGSNISYQWYTLGSNGFWIPITHAHSNSYTVIVHHGLNKSRYKCIVRDYRNNVKESGSAFLTVY